MLSTYQKLASIARKEFRDLVVSHDYPGKRSLGSCKLRLSLRDGSFIDVWLSSSRKYSYHWERRRQTGQLFRFDNAPDHSHLRTHPHHFHDGENRTVRPSRFPKRAADQLRFVLKYVREHF